MSKSGAASDQRHPGAAEPNLAGGAVTPVLPGFYPDLTIYRVGSDFYLANSSFEYFPGAPIFHSTDLTSWRQIGNILTRRTQFRRGDGLPSRGIYGATLRCHAGRFWFITTNVSDFSSGQVLVNAENPAGPWSDPVFIPEARGIDPDLCWIGGQCLLTWNALDFKTAGQIMQAPVDLTTGRLTAEPYPVWQGEGMQAPEGPHLYQIGQFWYLLIAEGGTERGHCVSVARARTPHRPFEPCPWNPIFTHQSTSHPVQNIGHADLVSNPDRGWAAVYLGARPNGSTPGFHVLGRETFLAGIEWINNWPLFNESKFDVVAASTAFQDDFTIDVLHSRWVAPSGEPESLAINDGSGLTLPARPDSSPGLLCARVRDHIGRRR